MVRAILVSAGRKVPRGKFRLYYFQFRDRVRVTLNGGWGDVIRLSCQLLVQQSLSFKIQITRIRVLLRSISSVSVQEERAKAHVVIVMAFSSGTKRGAYADY